jgi:hypothetical protein
MGENREAVFPSPNFSQNLIAQQQLRIMSVDTKPAAAINFLFLVHVDPITMYKTGLEIAKEFKAVFEGVFQHNLTNPNRDGHNLSYIADLEVIDKLKDKVLLSFSVRPEQVLYVIVPSILPREKIAPTNMAT